MYLNKCFVNIQLYREICKRFTIARTLVFEQLSDNIAIVIATCNCAIVLVSRTTNVFEQLCKSCCESAPLLAISNPLSSATQGDIEDIDLLKTMCQHN